MRRNQGRLADQYGEAQWALRFDFSSILVKNHSETNGKTLQQQEKFGLVFEKNS
jgi:hypothetical protein